MNKQKRPAVIAGNWKMNKNPAEARTLIEGLIPVVKDAGCGVIVCVPFTDLPAVLGAAKGTNIKVGAQNCHWAESGAFTGEIAASWLKDLGVEYVVIGHSERRQYFGETDQTVNGRTKAALAAGLNPIVCVGETLAQRESGQLEAVVTTQIKEGLKDITADQLKSIIIAYEPVWAIGTGVVATDDQAAEMCGFIRGLINGLYGSDAADAMVIQYGGSMNDANAEGLLSREDIDGGLIGGASLVADKFAAIVSAASK